MQNENPLQHLFDRQTLEAMVRIHLAHLTRQIEGLADAQVPTHLADIEACVTDAKRRYAIDIPVLRRDAVSYEMRDRPVPLILEDARGDRRTSSAHHYDFEVPFEGAAVYFDATPEGGLSCPLQGGVSRARSVLLINVVVPLGHDNEGRAARVEIDKRLDAIEGVLERLDGEALPLRARIEREFRAAIDERLELYQSNQARAQSVGYRLKRHTDAPVVPLVPKPIVSRAGIPGAETSKRHAGPVLADQSYEDVLKIVARMSRVMERNPSTFHKARENVIRDHFLVQLNGTFAGEALGEAFNQNGKTDILVRRGDDNIFVAECKIWRGEKEFSEAIDQLSGYVSWRDTKTALLVFNRRKDSTSVLGKMDATIQAHPSFVSKEAWARKGAFRYRMRHPADRDVLMTVTAMLFDVPAPIKRKGEH
ncbi:hypothetical protein KPL74_08805 [Bacillus sp. NP157]|nr:hypothetical protein KPL74_08805 [Bacillus sp. NP157]